MITPEFVAETLLVMQDREATEGPLNPHESTQGVLAYLNSLIEEHRLTQVQAETLFVAIAFSQKGWYNLGVLAGREESERGDE